MAFPLFDLNELPQSPQSPTINSPGLDDLETNGASFFFTNDANADANDGVDQPIELPEFVLNDLPQSPQSPTINSPGLADLETNGASFFSTNDANADANDGFNQPIELPEFNPDLSSMHLENEVRRKELSSAERLTAYECLLERTKEGILKRGSTRVVAAMFGVRIRVIQRLWKRARESGNHDHQTLRARNCGRKRIEFDMDRIRDIALRKRTTIRSLAFSLGVSKSFIQQKLKDKVIRRHTNAIKPLLTQDNLTTRIKHCLVNLDPSTLPHDPTYNQMENVVHIDEKWFYLSKKSQRYYLLHEEMDPVRTLKNSNFIPKVMFLVAVARPRYDTNGRCIFDGKIGVFPLVEYVAAVRSSHNRPRGTLEIKPITNITRNVMREFMIGKLLPAIVNKWPRDSLLEMIYIQQDNAKTHLHDDDVEFLSAVQDVGLNVTLVCQPPNSPDLNVLDLGFFRAIQSLQNKECAKSIVDLISAVENAYQTFSVKKSNYIFLTLQSCMNEILKCDGSNTYKIPHIQKETLQRLGTLPSTIKCSPEVYATAMGLISP